MPTLRGERFHIPLDDEDIAPDQPVSQGISGFTATGVLGDIMERTTTAPTPPVAPTFPSGNSSRGWPSHKKRYVSKQQKANQAAEENLFRPVTLGKESVGERERREIDEENRRRIEEMSPEEIEEERRELLANLDPALVERILNRNEAQNDTKKPNRSFVSERKVSFAVPNEKVQPLSERRTSAERHSVPPPSTPLDLPVIGTPPTRPHRVSSTDRKVSFSIPEAPLDDDKTSTAASHSLPLTPPASEGGSEPSSEHDSRRPSIGGGRKVSFSLPDAPEVSRGRSTASSHSIPSPKFPAEPTTTHPTMPRRIPSNERKVSFSLPPAAHMEESLSTAASHSIATPEPFDELPEPILKPASGRPSSAERKVSFASPSEEDDDDDARSTASRHSIPPTPPFNPVPDTDILHKRVHFPKPPAQPDLDPESETFLDDLHSKYFPTLAHDPSKLDWMKPIDPRESASYDPNQADEVHPKDIRFDFRGKIIPPSKSRSLPTTLGLHNHAAAPDAAGYTVAELSHLARSAYPAQRCIAIQTLGRLLFRLGAGEYGNEEDVIRKDVAGQRAMLAKGLWQEVEEGRAIETISEEAKKERGHQTSIALAQEALWNWQRGGGKHQKQDDASAGATRG